MPKHACTYCDADTDNPYNEEYKIYVCDECMELKRKPPKHPMEVIKEIDDHDDPAKMYSQYSKLIESIRHYFSPENMPTDEEIEKARIEYFDSGDFRLNDSIWHSACKWALERMKR